MTVRNLLLLFLLSFSAAAADLGPKFSWTTSLPLLGPVTNAADRYYSVKDPSVVHFGGKWHVFATVRGLKRSHQIEYISFVDWDRAESAERHFLPITDKYFCAPQVFYFTPHRKWYMIYQASDTNRPVALQPAFSSNPDVAEWKNWTAPEFLYDKHPENIKAWIDFWVICDEDRAHLFFTSNNGLMWQAETSIANFPKGWSEPKIVLKGDIFEASHTYRLQGNSKFLTVVEAVKGPRRYYKAYVADRLDGEWKPLAASWENPFAALTNVRDAGPHWTESYSHGEFLRTGVDERMEIDPGHLVFLFQGALDREIVGRKYGEIPWRLGLLTPAGP